MTGAVAGFLTSWTVTWWLVQAISSYFAANIAVGAAATCVAYLVAVSSTFGIFALLVAIGTRSLGSIARPIAIATLWVATEFVRARVLGDPWGLLGYTQYRAVPVLQVASLTGVYGVSFLVALVNAAVVEVMGAQGTFGRRARSAAVPGTILAVCVAAGVATLQTNDASPADPQRVAVIQTNVPPAYEWDRAYAERQLRQALRLTGQAFRSSPHFIVWPENALSLYLDQEPLLRESFSDLATRHDADLIVGGPRYARGHTYNAAHLVRAQDGAIEVYDKRRLVPFAEAPAFRTVSAARDESPRAFTPGRATGALRGREILGLSICHEILYPEVIHPAVADGATMLINIANDGWLDGGYGVASRQHFAMAVLRAVEARRYLVRAASTGVSGIVDPWGRIAAQSEPGAEAILTASVTARHGTTLYVRHGDWFAIGCLIYAIGTAVIWLAPERRRTSVRVPAPTAS